MQKNNGKPLLGIDGKIRPLRETLDSPGGSSTDVGDVSYNIPVVSLAATTAPKGVPWHSWSVVASSGNVNRSQRNASCSKSIRNVNDRYF